MSRDGDYVHATCECGKWKLDVLARADADVGSIVSHVTGEHEKHLENLDRLAQATPKGARL
jgi:hypothetical protein